MPSRRGLELDRGERLYYRGGLRKGGEIAVTDARVLVRDDDELTSVPYTNVSEVATESFNWFLSLLSGALVLFGLYSIPENALLGGTFAAFGLWSIYRSYRHRDRVRIHTHSQPKPVEVFPENVDTLYDELEPAIEAARAERGRETAESQ
ncbi:hypothetical protein EA462_02595 [Natrarchaeobius halalkaliphilus]|uniref:Uncharacterized protein n=1 Tax=Natrarchaeobius halalkaliphilus TaxID=1679091 RepID=A0A3N6N4K3_9EURY|nr:hypothetical protein [Natrarchaeobius halalkaliphilus]RQG93112.1 hypothetical protein EA462_02595 [Natrarchaeobius halalkaliphilus]